MSKDSDSKCVRSKYFTGQADMDESLSDFKEEKKSCKGPKPAQKPAKPKAKKVTKRIKGQKDIRTALNGKKNELIKYSKEFDTVCKKSGLDVDSEQLQLAIALSKSLQTESNTPESSQTLSSQQRVAKIRKTLQEYGFKVPEAKITAGRKKYRKKYKLLTVTEEEKHQIITEKYTRILFENPDQSIVQLDSTNDLDTAARVFYIGSSIPYDCMKDNNIFYVNDLVEKSTTSGSLLRDWSEIPGRPESPKIIDNYTMSFKDIDCSQDELDVILSGPIKSIKDIFASKEIDYKRKYKECDVPKIVIEDEEKPVNKDTDTKVNNEVINIDDNVNKIGPTENKSPFQKALNMESPVKKVLDGRSPVNRLFENKTLASKEIEIISPIKQASANSLRKVIDVETSNKIVFTQQCRSCSPDIFDDELSSIMETTKPIIVLSQEHKTKVFSQDNFMDLTQCANIPSQKYEKGIQLSQNVTKRRSNDFMEITECIVGSSQPTREKLKEIDLTQSPEGKGAKVEDEQSIILGENVSRNATDSISQNITDEQQITVLSNHSNTDSHQNEKENIDLTQSSNEDDKDTSNIEKNNQTPYKKVQESMDLTQSSNSTDTSLPLVDVGNSQSQASLDDTIIVDKDEYLAKIKNAVENTAPSHVFDLTQAQDTSIEHRPSPLKLGNRESCSNSFYEDFVHDHSENAESSKEIARNSDSNEHNSSHNETKESNDDIDLTQGSSSSEEIISSQRLITEFESVPNNSSLGKQDDVSIDYDEIIIEDNVFEKESANDSRLTEPYNKSEVNNDIEVVDENDDNDINSSQNSEAFQISDKELDYSLNKSRRGFSRDNLDQGSEKDRSIDSYNYEINNDIEIVDENNDADINSSQNSEVFHISDKELDYSLHKSRHDIPRNSFDFHKEIEIDKTNLKSDSSKSEVDNDIEILNGNNDADINSSQNSQAFQISDKELDYSLQKSRRDFYQDNFDFGGISVLDNVTKLGSYRRSLSQGCQPYSTENKNDTVEDSFLPEVYVKKTEHKIVETTQLEAEGVSPIKVHEVLKSNNGIINIKTPKNSEYIIKTVDVTPMADYASMSTPQRNRELDKYGLKPFKRKRAIQILTHVYNQTHPTIQQLAEEDQPSPCKKPKTNTYAHESPPKTFNSLTEPSPSKIVTGCSKTPVKSPKKFVYKKPSHKTRLLASSLKNDELERDSNMFSATSSERKNIHAQDSPLKRFYSQPETFSLNMEDCAMDSITSDEVRRKTPVKSPRKFVYKKPRQEIRLRPSPTKTDELKRNRHIFSASAPSPIKPYGLERERNISSATSSIRSSELERETGIFSATPNKTDEIKVTDACGYEVTSETAVIKNVDCCPEDWVFQKREKAKVHSCRVPLHIAFHNYVLSRRSLREAILKYEPVNIDVIHKDLVGYGHRYDPKDLLKFLDKKCITVKTTDNNAKNNKR